MILLQPGLRLFLMIRINLLQLGLRLAVCVIFDDRSLQIPTIFVGQKQGEILRRAATTGNSWVELHCSRVQQIDDQHGHIFPPIRWPPEDDCVSNPCKNGATCVAGADPTQLHRSGTRFVYSGYTCSCPGGFSGEHCEGYMRPSTCTDDPTWRNWVTGANCTELLEQWKVSPQGLINLSCQKDKGTLEKVDNETEMAGDAVNRLIYAYEACRATCAMC